MGGYLHSLSIRSKLMMALLLASMSTLAISTTALLVWDNSNLQDATVENAYAITRSLQQSFIKMLLLDEPEVAADTVMVLRSFPQIRQVVFYEQGFTPVFRYQREGESQLNLPNVRQLRALQISQEQIELVEPLEVDGVNFGQVYVSLDTDFIQFWKSNQRRRVVALVVLTLILAGLFALVLERYLSKPVVQLAQAMTEVEANSDFSKRVRTREKHEIGQLFDGFNRLVEGIDRRNKELSDYKDALDQAAIVSVANVMGKIIYANDKFIEVSGYSREELLRQNHRILKSDIHPQAFYKELWRTIARGSIWKGEICNRNKEGKYYWVDSTIIPFLDENGRPLRYISIRYLITDKKQAEANLKQINNNLENTIKKRTEALQKANDLLVQSEKMAALGELVAGVAHEINTPVGIGVTAISHLQSEVSALQQQVEQDRLSRESFNVFMQDADESCRIIYSNLEKAARLIRSFKQVASDQSHEAIREFDLREYLDEVLLSLRPNLKKTAITVTLDCEDGIAMKADAGALAQIISNFVSNSLRYAFDVEEAGEIIVQATKVYNDRVELRFSDNGKGMSRTAVAKVFDPFYTTGRAHGGTGLGLHIVYNLVTQKLNGQIECQSQLGEGTSFLLQIPLNNSGL